MTEMSLAINGFGRIGRGVFRALFERSHDDLPAVVQINEPAPLETICHLLKYDTTYGRFNAEVLISNKKLYVDGHEILVTHHRNVDDVDWRANTIVECSGQLSIEQIRALCRRRSDLRVIISNPAKRTVDATVIFGLNQSELIGNERVISCGSCTSNALIPVLDLLDKNFGIESGASLTLHSAMHDQPVIDAYHDVDLRLTRSALQSVIPVDTKLHIGVERVLPKLAGKLDSFSVRVPTTIVSAIDLSVNLSRECSDSDLLKTLTELCRERQGVFTMTDEPLASIDFAHDSHSGVIDLGQTRLVSPKFLKLFIWFDNEWGYSNRLVDTLVYIQSITSKGASVNDNC